MDLGHTPNAEDHLLFSPRAHLPLREERAKLSDAELEQRLHQVREAAGVREQLVERFFYEAQAQKAKKNLGEVDEVVFGRDTDGSNKVTLPGATDRAHDRVSSKAMLPPKMMPYLEVGEVVFGKPSPTGTRPPPADVPRLRASPEYPRFPSPASARRYGDASPRVMGSYGALQQQHSDDDREQERFATVFSDRGPVGGDRAPGAHEMRLRSQRSHMPFGPTPASLGQPPLSDEEERRLYADLVDIRGKPLGMEGAYSPRKAECAAKGVRSQLPGMPLEHQGVTYEPPMPPGYYLRPDELGIKARGPHAGLRSHSVLYEDGLLTDSPRPCTPPKPPHPLSLGTLSLEHGKVIKAPVGSFIDADGSVRRPNGFPGRAARTVLTEAEAGWKWNPRAHEAASAARHAARLDAKRLQEPHASRAQGIISGVEELVFRGEDPSTWTPAIAPAVEATSADGARRQGGGRDSSTAELLHYVEAGTMPPTRQGGPSHGDSQPRQRTLTARETTALQPRHSLRRTTGMLDYHEYGEPSARSPRDEGGRAEASPGGRRTLPGPQAPETARTVLYGDGRAKAAGLDDWVREPLDTDIHGRAIPEGHLGAKVGAHSVYTRPRHLQTGSANGNPGQQQVKGCDYLGRAEATSNVDEAMFGKTPQGGKLRQVNVSADFNLNRFGVCSNNPFRYD